MWESECIERVRVLVNDLDTTQKYDDCRINRVLVVAASQLIQEIYFDVTYTVNISQATISPDPADDPRDETFLNLLSLKTAVLISNGEWRRLGGFSMRISDGPSTIDIGGAVEAAKNLYNMLNEQYEKEKLMQKFGKNGHAITTPTTYWDV